MLLLEPFEQRRRCRENRHGCVKRDWLGYDQVIILDGRMSSTMDWDIILVRVRLTIDSNMGSTKLLIGCAIHDILEVGSAVLIFKTLCLGGRPRGVG